MSAMSNYLENNLIDFLLRNQAFTPPSTVYVALFTSAPSDAGGGTEVSGGNYARVPVTSSLANWAGTQSSGSTAASTGTGGQTSNNAKITFPAPSSNWGTVTSIGLFSAATSGNLLFHGSLDAPKTINNEDAAPEFAVGELKLTLA